MRTLILALVLAGCSGPPFEARLFSDDLEPDGGSQVALQGGSGGEAQATDAGRSSGGLDGAGGASQAGTGGKELSGAGGLPAPSDAGTGGVSLSSGGAQGTGGSLGSGGAQPDPMDGVLSARRDCTESNLVPCSEWRVTVDTRVVGLACTNVSAPMPVDWCHASGIGGWCCVP